jgi:hypothetical protein
MKRLLLMAAIVFSSGCAAPTQPETAMQPAPPPSPPQILHTLVLASPQGQGAVELRRESRRQDGAVTYSASGAIVATDDVGQWQFAYTKTSLEGAAAGPTEWIVGLHAVAVRVTNTSGADLEVDWENSLFVDPSGRAQRVIHRSVQLNQLTAPLVPSTIAAGATLSEFIVPSGGIIFSSPSPGMATLWNAPPVLERLPPGSGFSIMLTVKSREITTPRTFRFSAGAPPR